MGLFGKALKALSGSGASGNGSPGEPEPRRALLLRRVFPPDRPAVVVGHFGGAPRLPESLEWPRYGRFGAPMTFVASIDLAALPKVDGCPETPREGALLAFIASDGDNWCDGDEEDHPMGAVIHVEGEASERRPPDDAQPCYGKDWRHYFKSLADDALAPRLFPAWPIEARAIDSRCEAGFEDETPEGIDRRAGEAARLNVAAATAAYEDTLPKRIYAEDPDPLPPEPYPELWAMIASAAGAIGFDNQFALDARWGRVSPKARPAYLEAIAEARAWETEARARSPWDRPGEENRRRFRDWIDALNRRRRFTPDKDFGSTAPSDDVFLVSASTLPETRGETLDRLVAEDPARLRSLAPDAETLIRWRHAVAYRAVNDTIVVAHQMFGWGAEIQDVVARRRDDVLLLQLDSDYGIGWMWGDVGVIQFWISPKNLAARRFDRVVVTFAGH